MKWIYVATPMLLFVACGTSDDDPSGASALEDDTSADEGTDDSDANPDDADGTSDDDTSNDDTLASDDAAPSSQGDDDSAADADGDDDAEADDAAPEAPTPPVTSGDGSLSISISTINCDQWTIPAVECDFDLDAGTLKISGMCDHPQLVRSVEQFAEKDYLTHQCGLEQNPDNLCLTPAQLCANYCVFGDAVVDAELYESNIAFRDCANDVLRDKLENECDGTLETAIEVLDQASAPCSR